MINNQNLLEKISEWSIELKNNNNKHIHFAFLEIFIEFENFLMNSFIEYSLGNSSEKGFFPSLRINFSDKEHLEGLLKCNKQFIDYIKKIEEVKKYIFEENTCPFTKIFATAEFTTYFKQMQIIRNFITHQSEESKRKYVDKVLNPNGINDFIKADTFLKRNNRRINITYYSRYIDMFKFYSDIICNPNF
jgi:ribosomal protein S18